MEIGFIGSGNVGASASYACLLQGLGTQHFLVDINEAYATAQAEDIRHAAPFTYPVRVHSTPLEKLKGCDILVLAAGVNQKEGETRLDLLKRNRDIYQSLIPELLERNRDAIFIIATNPVDIMTQVAWEIVDDHGLDTHRVIGTGTILDTARFRSLIGEHLDVSPHSVHAYVLGEHGDTEVLNWSAANIGNISLESFSAQRQAPLTNSIRETIDDNVRNAAYTIIKGKGSTYYGIGGGIARIIKAIINDERAVLTCSHPTDYFKDIGKISFSRPLIIGKSGVHDMLDPTLSEAELDLLHKSAETLFNAYNEM